jgi:hypothetical protein
MVRSSLKRSLFPLLFAAVAHAQYAPSSLGLGPQATAVIGDTPMVGVDLEYARYLESGFVFFADVPILIASTAVGADTPTGSGRVFATGGRLGVRYLFTEGMVRPWVALQLAGLVLVTKPEVTWYAGAGTSVGLDWILSESFALGARLVYDVFVDLNRPWRQQLGGSINVSVLF